MSYDQDYDGLWEEDGCYNTSLYQKTEYYHTYQQVIISIIILNYLIRMFHKMVNFEILINSGF